jgi:hypothetical protein
MGPQAGEDDLIPPAALGVEDWLPSLAGEEILSGEEMGEALMAMAK